VKKDLEAPEEGVSRRQALKRMAAVGGAVWIAPVLQTVNMARAQAGTPRQNCFSVKISAGNKCEEPGPSGGGFHCLTPVTTPLGGCAHVSAVSTGSGASWVIDLGSCSFLEGQVHSGGGSGSCCPINIAPGTTGVITVPRCASGPHGQLQDISGVELTICCPTA
jgi:hypothetical protein